MKKEKLIEIANSKSKTNKALAKEIGIDETTFYRKLNRNGETFTILEANRIIAALQLSPEEACDIFFEKKLA